MRPATAAPMSSIAPRLGTKGARDCTKPGMTSSGISSPPIEAAVSTAAAKVGGTP